MLLLQSRIMTLPIASIQAGHRIGTITGFVIQPKGLSIKALVIESSMSKEYLYLHTEDILETRSAGILIDHNEQLMESEDLVRLKDLIEIDYHLLAKPVITESKKKIGSVMDYIINTSGWQVQKIHVQPPLVKMLSRPDRIIDRAQIVKVTEKSVIVSDASLKNRALRKTLSRPPRLSALKASHIKHN